MKREPVDLSVLVLEVLDIFLARVSEKLNALWSDFDPAIHFLVLADGTELRNVLVELIENAWKFTDQGEIILTVRLLGPSEESAEIEFSVEDTGQGMAPEIIARLAEGTDANKSGQSLQIPEAQPESDPNAESGLIVSRKTIASMGGAMRIANQRGRGTIARFTIPFEKAVVGA
ncbi:MAG: hypothetical protein K8S54_16970 [Spirochaetia bacterium]|nr:hypothetical protein [Spirochaetia bacterium]